MLRLSIIGALRSLIGILNGYFDGFVYIIIVTAIVMTTSMTLASMRSFTMALSFHYCLVAMNISPNLFLLI